MALESLRMLGEVLRVSMAKAMSTFGSVNLSVADVVIGGLWQLKPLAELAGL